jgi:DMSO/TMAO reductase YedYZ molybdopterin-dependent catalytic subunit
VLRVDGEKYTDPNIVVAFWKEWFKDLAKPKNKPKYMFDETYKLMVKGDYEAILHIAEQH